LVPFPAAKLPTAAPIPSANAVTQPVGVVTNKLIIIGSIILALAKRVPLKKEYPLIIKLKITLILFQ